MGGGSLKWGPPLVKIDPDYRFLPLFLSGFVGRCIFEFDKNFVKWVCDSDANSFVAFVELDVFGKFDVFENKVSTDFSLE